MIAVVDSGVANLASVLAAVSRLGRSACVTTDRHFIETADHVILPGVGAASAAMQQLRRKGLIDVLRGAKQPVLGICLGMQLLFGHSDEGQGVECLGIVAGNVGKLAAAPDRPVPHMGWNTLRINENNHPLLRGIADGSFMYFTHSFAAPAGEHTLASTEYGESFAAIVAHKNFMGCQFHPERSGQAGLRLIENFLGL